MDFAFDETTTDLVDRVGSFMEELVYPAEATFHQQVAAAGNRWEAPPVIEELKAEARARCLWNLFLPTSHEGGAGLTNLQYAPLCELMGRSPWLAPEAFNCNAPDTGNMELLSVAATPEQRQRWLEPLLEGEIRSAFAMTEPAVASSDASNISTTIRREGDEYVVDGVMPKLPLTVSVFPPRTCSAARATASAWPRSGWAPAGSTTRCARSACQKEPSR